MTDHNDMNDPLDELFRAAGAQPARPAVIPPVTFKPAVERAFTEPCRKCAGRGDWRPGYPCFACKGTGRLTFKTAPQDRAKARDRAVEKRQEAAVAKADEIKAWQAAYPVVWAWMLDNERKNGTPQAFPFAIALYEALFQYGSLTENQMAAAERCIARKAERQAARAAEAPAVSAAGVDRLKAAFDHAIAYSAAKGLTKAPRITIGGLTIKPAKAASANPGALYVTEGETYLGKVVNGRFYASAACKPGHGQEAKVLGVIADPEAAAKVYGQETGVCCICNATLRSEWRLRGIGPICAEKFGWGG